MDKFTTTTTFPNGGPFPATAHDRTVIVDANGGSMAIEANMGDGTWIALPDSPYSADTVFRLEVSGTQFRFTPSGGATVAVSN
tara:strand:- start:289 stop:537 length:249 start_codon:yes stop_codon:yes gene_type:complete